VQGRSLAWLTCGSALGLTLALTGCGKAPTLDLPGPAADPPPETGAGFVSHDTGSIEGRVVWDGEAPVIGPFRAPSSPFSERPLGPRRDWPNPNAPTLGQGHQRPVRGAVVYLEGIDPQRGRPWDHPPVRVEQRGHRLQVRQGEIETQFGFVHRGATIEMISRDDTFYSLQARGAAFFTLPFLDAGQPRTRRLDRNGIVELTSNAGHFWMHSYLFVSDHPYFTHTAPDGSFQLSQIPPGRYRLVNWMPDWHPADRELDADTWQVTRMTFYPPRTKARMVKVEPGRNPPVWFYWTTDEFENGQN
jgi:hypothetical protein